MTRNTYGRGEVSYVGFMPSDALAEKILAGATERAGVKLSAARHPLVVRSGTLRNGNRVRYLLNYLGRAQPVLGAWLPERSC